jgi:hypothetical protein
MGGTITLIYDVNMHIPDRATVHPVLRFRSGNDAGRDQKKDSANGYGAEQHEFFKPQTILRNARTCQLRGLRSMVHDVRFYSFAYSFTRASRKELSLLAPEEAI